MLLDGQLNRNRFPMQKSSSSSSVQNARLHQCAQAAELTSLYQHSVEAAAVQSIALAQCRTSRVWHKHSVEAAAVAKEELEPVGRVTVRGTGHRTVTSPYNNTWVSDDDVVDPDYHDDNDNVDNVKAFKALKGHRPPHCNLTTTIPRWWS